MKDTKASCPTTLASMPSSSASCISIFNVSENRKHRGWEGSMTMPRHLSLHKDYLAEHTSKKGFRNFFSPLQIKPPAGLESLRFNPVKIGPRSSQSLGQ